MQEPESFGPGGDAPHDKPLEYEQRREDAPPDAQAPPAWALAVGRVVKALAGLVFLLGLVALLAGSLWLGAYLWGYRVKWWPLLYCTGLGLTLYSISAHFTGRARRYAAATAADALATKLRRKQT